MGSANALLPCEIVERDEPLDLQDTEIHEFRALSNASDCALRLFSQYMYSRMCCLFACVSLNTLSLAAFMLPVEPDTPRGFTSIGGLLGILFSLVVDRDSKNVLLAAEVDDSL